MPQGQRYPKVHPDGRADHRTPLPHRQRPRAPRPRRYESLQRLSESAVTALLYEHTAANIAEVNSASSEASTRRVAAFRPLDGHRGYAVPSGRRREPGVVWAVPLAGMAAVWLQ